MFKFHVSCPPTLVLDTLLDKAAAPTLPDVMDIFVTYMFSGNRNEIVIICWKYNFEQVKYLALAENYLLIEY